MMSASDIRKLTSLSGESREAVTSAFEALEQWRDEIFSANERHLTKVNDQMAAAQRAMGWPDQFTAAAKEQLTKASKMQTHMLDQVMDAWERQLKSPNIGWSLSEGLKFQAPPFFGPGLTDPVSEMIRLQELTLTPFRLWIQAAEMWQRNWASVMSGAPEARDSPSAKTRATAPGRTSARP